MCTIFHVCYRSSAFLQVFHEVLLVLQCRGRSRNGRIEEIVEQARQAAAEGGKEIVITCKEGVDRNKVVPYIEAHGVQTRMLFAGNLIKHPCFDQMRASGKGYRVIGDLSVTDRVMNNTFWVGVYPGMTDEMIDYMAKTITEAVNQ